MLSQFCFYRRTTENICKCIFTCFSPFVSSSPIPTAGLLKLAVLEIAATWPELPSPVSIALLSLSALDSNELARIFRRSFLRASVNANSDLVLYAQNIWFRILLNDRNWKQNLPFRRKSRNSCECVNWTYRCCCVALVNRIYRFCHCCDRTRFRSLDSGMTCDAAHSSLRSSVDRFSKRWPRFVVAAVAVRTW